VTEIDWTRVPIFGQRAPDVEYRLRPGAYAFIERAAGELALVRTPEGVFLPGGGIEAGETPDSALLREALEECGFVIQVGAPVAHAVQFVLSRVERGHLEKRCIFMDAQLVSALAAPTERDHELIWESHEAAAELLAHTSQRWAVKIWSAGR
jgi:8-oxo-dGTP diphosphatase